MANKYANLIGTNLIKDEYTKINTGFDAVETDINTVKTDIANHGTAADPHDQYALDTDLATLQTEVEVHKADNVTQLALKANKLQEAWIAPTLVNSWANYSSVYNAVGYFKDNFGIVHLKGFIAGGVVSAGTQLFTLPAGYIPTFKYALAALSRTSDGVAKPFILEISNTGVVLLGTPAANTWLTLDGLSFKAGV